MIKKETLKLLVTVVNFVAFGCSHVLAGDYNYGGFSAWERNNTSNNQETSLIGFIPPPDISDSDDIFPSETSDSLDSSLMELNSSGDFSSETGSYKQWYGETPVRHTWSDSENFVLQNVLAQTAMDPTVHGVEKQVAFKHGSRCSLFTEGSSIADIALQRTDGSWLAIEVKNYETMYYTQLAHVLNEQIEKYHENLPNGSDLIVAIDIRGQTPSENTIYNFCSHVNLDPESIVFFGAGIPKTELKPLDN